jgi:predicted signal transduction protein with EAL and GGDEF domain
LLARVGGDEFAILLEDVAGPVEIETVARGLVRCFESPFAVGPHYVSVTASVGITLCPGDGADPLALLNNADIAMYRAKQWGRNAFKFFTRNMRDEIAAANRLGSDLGGALERGGFFLLYQPQLGLADRRLRGLEALLRWKHPERGVVGPAEFLDSAESTGQIVPISLWVLEQVCAQLRKWDAAGTIVPRVSVNVAPMHLYQPDLAARIKDALKNHAIAADRLELEINERLLREDPDGLRARLAALKEVGVRLAVDGFGTGYSCLKYLRRLPIDVLKIDRSFVRSLEASAEDSALCGVIVSIARGFSLESVAVGVETRAQLEDLMQKGCQYGQGNLLSPPLTPDELVPAARPTQERVVADTACAPLLAGAL